MIFTTARVRTTDADLAAARIETGDVDLSDSRFSERPWVAYQYHRSPGLKHAAAAAERPGSLTRLMDSEYLRMIAVVSAGSVAKNILATISCAAEYSAASISCAVRNFLQHYRPH